MPTVRAIFLDAGNTLFTERRPRSAVYSTVSRNFGGRSGEEEAAEWMGRVFEEIPSSVDGAFRYSLAWFESFNYQVLEGMGVSERRREEAHQDLLARFESPRTYRVFPEVPSLLESLSNLGITVGVVSNWSERLPMLLESLGIARHLNFIVTSAEMRVEKPERAIFERALFRAGVPGEDALHVGDHLERDVYGALGAGLRAGLLDRSSEGLGTTSGGIPLLPDLRAILELVEQPSHAARS